MIVQIVWINCFGYLGNNFSNSKNRMKTNWKYNVKSHIQRPCSSANTKTTIKHDLTTFSDARKTQNVLWINVPKCSCKQRRKNSFAHSFYICTKQTSLEFFLLIHFLRFELIKLAYSQNVCVKYMYIIWMEMFSDAVWLLN